ncbi:MAG TPA: acyl-CoA dehydrogenase family protein [Caulobacteraceae bacterium]|jgi:alkylation response protein AidB-like acyl-CoA dehydrogenase|nr:acyl-CoA dehydrogenase family protein [Caulobacteraceae bacterium]
MNLKETAEESAFRESARAWLSANAPKTKRPTERSAAIAFDKAWQQSLHAAGWAGVNWPKEYGGRGLSGFQYMIWVQECVRAGAPISSGANFTGLFHAGPTLIVRGNDEQKREHLPKILRGEAMWCQGFSEPGAGTDLAALRTRGEVDGDFIVINGSKAWTSNGHFADYQELLVRTDPASTRHHGLTWLICDMHAPGIEVRPVRTMDGEVHVNETFYDNVRIPISNVVGEIGQGWSVAMSTFAFERGIGFIGDQIELIAMAEDLIGIARRVRLPSGKLAIDDDGVAQQLAALKCEALALRALTISGLAHIERHGQPGPEGSMMKLLLSTAYKKLHQVAGDILGPEFLDYPDADSIGSPWAFRYFRSWVLTIAAGPNEIHRDIIADRILGLPRAR